jgi:hypothetical protein
MLTILRRWCGLLLLSAPALAAAQGQEFNWVDPSLRWRTLDTANFSVHFPAEHAIHARTVARLAESVYPRITQLLQWRPASRTHVVVLDAEDFANGYASPLPFNYFAIFLTPPDEGELLQNHQWLELVITHELFHVIHLDMARQSPLAARSVFGRVPLLFPNALEPRWITEGLAVHAESDAAARHGRLGQSQFEGMMRAEAARGLRSLREINADGRGFPLNRNYLYGSYFFAFLQERYGGRALADYIENYSGNLIPFRLQSNAIAATGKPMDALWLEYHDWLRARFAPPSPAPETIAPVVAAAFVLRSPVLHRSGVRWFVQSDGYTRPRLMRQSAGRDAEKVREVEHDARVFAAPDGGVMLAQPEICRNYRHYYDLFAVAPDGASRRLTHCGRYRLVAPLGEGRMAALRVEAGAAEVVILDATGAVTGSLYRAAPGEALTGLAAKGTRVVLTSFSGGVWSLVEVGGGSPTVLLADEAVKHSPRFADTPDEIYFVADYGKTYNLWSLRPIDGSLQRWTDAWTGVKEISAPLGGEILLSMIEADGDVLRLHKLPSSALERRTAPAPASPVRPADLAGADGEDRPYSPWSSLLPRSWLPLITLADGTVALGVATFGQDALGLHQYALAPVYEFTQREMLGNAQYVYDLRHGVSVWRGMTVKANVDKGGGFLRNRDITAYTVSEAAQWVSLWRHLSLNRRFYWGLGGAVERETLRGSAVAAAEVQDERVLALLAGIDTRREQWLSEGPSQGQQLRLFAETSRRLHAAYTGNVYRADWRGHLPLRKTVLALRWNEAYGQPGAERFELGGSDPDETFILPVVNQREFALRGYTSGEPALTGQRARVGSAEWRVPVADVDRHLMVPPVGLNRVSVNLFLDVGAAWDRGERPDYHRGAGVELMSEIRIGYLFAVQARLGFARGLDAAGRSVGYLTVGRAF